MKTKNQTLQHKKPKRMTRKERVDANRKNPLKPDTGLFVQTLVFLPNKWRNRLFNRHWRSMVRSKKRAAREAAERARMQF